MLGKKYISEYFSYYSLSCALPGECLHHPKPLPINKSKDGFMINAIYGNHRTRSHLRA